MPGGATWWAIAAGGAAGSVLRAAVSAAVARVGWPPGTLVVNLLGSALLGALVAWLPSRTASPAVTAALTTGLCGGFTTMSALALEVVQLGLAGAPGRALLYGVGSLAGSVAAAALGYLAAR